MAQIMTIITGVYLIIYGILMKTMPQKVIKKEWRDIQERLDKMKKNSIIVIICGIVIVLASLGLMVLKM